MPEKSISEQIIDEFIRSLKRSDLISNSKLDKLKKLIESERVVTKRQMISFLKSEDES